MILPALALTLCAAERAATAQDAARGGVRVVAHEVSLGKDQPGEIEHSRVVSPDGRRVAFAARVEGGETVFVDGVPNKPHTKYLASSLTEGGIRQQIVFSPDGRRYAYVANQGGREFVVVDGVEGRQYDDIDDLRFTSDGRHVVFAARRAGKSLIVVDGVEGREYDGSVPWAALRVSAC